MIEDVRLAVQDRLPVHFYGRQGGVTPTPQEVLKKVLQLPRGFARDLCPAMTRS